MLEFALFGALGQLIRSSIGLKKALHRGRKLKWKYWLATMFLGAFIGAVAGWLSTLVFTEGSQLIAFVSGYAGSDFFEGLVKKR